MLRQSPNRNQRFKGLKVKHGLQFFLLLAICFWLVYQVKHSHDKKKEFDADDSKISHNTGSHDEFLKLGRKDLHPQEEETTKKNEKHDEEEADETGGGEEEESKLDEEEQEEDTKTEEKEGEGRGGGDDDTDEQDQEKSDMEVDREEDFIDEEKETEEGDEKESEEADVEDKDGQMENDESSLEDNDRDAGAINTHEAREELYKADDASSAVTHDTQTISSENENGSLVNSNENADMNILEQENKFSNTEEIGVGQNTTGLNVEYENGTSLNGTVNEEKSSEVVPSKSQGSAFSNSTIKVSGDQPELSNNGLSRQNGTETTSDSTQAQNTTEGVTTSIASDNNQSDSNSTISISTQKVEATPRESSNSSTNLGFIVSEKITRSNASAEAEDKSGTSTTDINTDSTQNEKSDTINGTDETDENSGSSKAENVDEVQHDPIDSSDLYIPLEEKEAHTDLDSLPEIRTVGNNGEDAAAE